MNGMLLFLWYNIVNKLQFFIDFVEMHHIYKYILIGEDGMFFIICGVILPIVFVIYNIIYYFNKKVIYTIKKDNFIIINDTFFKIQLFLSCLNAIFVSMVTYYLDKYNSSVGLLLFILIFWGINYLIKFIAILKKYAKIEKN